MNRALLSRHALTLLAAFALSFAPRAAAAQGTCRCNTGCHQYPGQCVQRPSDTGCSPGYAPFCGTRASSCPQTGWVTCNGQCTCVRVGPVDGGAPGPDGAVADVPASMPDVATTDVVSRDAPGLDVTGMDVPASFDAPRLDGTTPTDAPFTPTDRPGTPSDTPGTPSDTPGTPSDTPGTPSDTPIPSSDTPSAPGDAPTVPLDGSVSVIDATSTPDAGCVCDGGVCLSNVCLTERCSYQNELGFICPLPNHTCHIVGEEAWCAPACLDVTCEAGSFCDPSDGTCRVDQCATIRCASGSVCRENRCVPAPDSAVGDGATTPPTAGQDGCGCRAMSLRRSISAALFLPALAAILRRRRARR